MSLRRPAAALLTLVAWLGLPKAAEAWGFAAHRMVNRKAIQALPPPLHAFFERNAAYVVEHSIEYFRLFALSSDARSILLYQAGVHTLRSNRPRVEQAAFEATGGFVGNDAGEAYLRGALGPTLAKGGDGTAERRYLETAALVARQLTRLTDFAVEPTAWDLLLAELPPLGAALHTLLRERSQAQPYVDDALRLADTFVGRLVQGAGTATIVAVTFGPGALAVAGPGAAARVDLGTIRQLDVAPTLCALIGLDPPANATGKLLEAALALKP